MQSALHSVTCSSSEAVTDTRAVLVWTKLETQRLSCQVPGAREHADGVGSEPVRCSRSKTVSLTAPLLNVAQQMWLNLTTWLTSDTLSLV